LLDSLLDRGLHLLLPLASLHAESAVILRLQLSQVYTFSLAQDLWATLLEGLQFGLHALGDCSLLLDALLLQLYPLLQELVASLEEVGCRFLAPLASSEDIIQSLEDGVVWQSHVCNRLLALSLWRHVSFSKDFVFGTQRRQHKQHPLDVREVAFRRYDAGLELTLVGLTE
jgi:hypothetical protein